MRKKILLISVILVMFGCLFFAFDKHRVKDKVYFSDKKYLILEYPSDIFTYYHYSNKYFRYDVDSSSANRGNSCFNWR